MNDQNESPKTISDHEKARIDVLAESYIQMMFIDFEKKNIPIDATGKAIIRIAFNYGMIAGFSIWDHNLKKISNPGN